MISAGVDGFTVNVLFLQAQPSADDPLGNLEHIAIKISGGLSASIGDDQERAVVAVELRTAISDLVEDAISEALQKPDETVAKAFES